MRKSPKRSNSRKARRARNRSRAARARTDGMVEEFLAPDDATDFGSRPIPIKSRREFMPTAPSAEPSVADGQLTFALRPRREDGTTTRPLVAQEREEVVSKARHSHESSGQTVEASSSDPVFPEIASRLGVAFKDVASRREIDPSEQSFSMSRFLSGCAMGSAAAAAILLFVCTVLG